MPSGCLIGATLGEEVLMVMVEPSALSHKQAHKTGNPNNEEIEPSKKGAVKSVSIFVKTDATTPFDGIAAEIIAHGIR